MGADGRYEKILKDVLEDRTLTDAECRLVMYLAAKPPGWTVYPELVAKDLKRSLRHWVSPTLRLLLARGLVTKHGGRIPGQPNSVVTYRLVRELVVKTADLGSAGSDTTPDLGSAGSGTTIDQPKLSDLGSAGSVVTETAELIKRTDLKERTKTLSADQNRSADPRGTRIPENFLEQLYADKSQGAWFREECPDVDPRVENQKFVNHWVSKTGRDATKRDWVRTWRNWMLKSQQEANRFKPRPPSAPEDGGWVQPVSPFRGLS